VNDTGLCSPSKDARPTAPQRRQEPYDSLQMLEHNQRYVDISAVSSIVAPRLIWQLIIASHWLST
jgi:hypothetical protein